VSEIPDLRGGSWKTVLAIISPLAAGAAMFGGLVWQAARYPDRAEFEQVKAELRAAVTTYQNRAANMEKDIAVTAVHVETIQQSQQRIERKLDKQR